MTVRTAESYRQKALTMAEPFKDVSRKISAEDALAAMSPEAMQMLMEKLKARLGVKADAEGKTL
jgi:hypothetical protein